MRFDLFRRRISAPIFRPVPRLNSSDSQPSRAEAAIGEIKRLLSVPPLVGAAAQMPLHALRDARREPNLADDQPLQFLYRQVGAGGSLRDGETVRLDALFEDQLTGQNRLGGSHAIAPMGQA